MKKIFAFLLAGLMIFGIGCKKDLSKNDPINPENPTTWQQNISPDFDWNMWKDVSVMLTNTQNKIILITTVDGEGQYAKMMGIKDSYQMTFRIPKITEQISINGNVVNILNGAVNYALPADYKSVANAQWALDFDHNANDYISTGNPGIVAYPFTMEAWIKTAGYAGDMAIMGYCSSTNDEYQFGVYVSAADGKLNIRSKKGILNEEQKGSVVVTDDNWHHVAVVFASASISRLYVDGTIDATEIDVSPLSPSEVDLFAIGRWGDLTPDSYFDGLIDEVRLWDTVRSATEVNTYRTRSIENPYEGMAGYWPMEEGTGVTTANLKGGTASLASPDWSGSVDTDEDGVANINDDYPHDPTRAFNNYWPASSQGATLAFEDLWPSMGDFDMNDCVIGYRFNRVTNASNNLVEGIGDFELKANGAGLMQGFGFSLPENIVADNHLQITGYEHSYLPPYYNRESNGSETDQTFLTVVADTRLNSIGNTIPGYVTAHYYFSIKISIISGSYSIDDLAFQTWNPFIFVYSYLHEERGREVHLPGYKPTDLAKIILFDSIDDGSYYPTGSDGTFSHLWYKTNINANASGDSIGRYFPWGLDIPGNFSWTREADLVHQPVNGFYRPTIWFGYLKFKQWASSNGTEALDWYSGTGIAYRDNAFIYHP